MAVVDAAAPGTIAARLLQRVVSYCARRGHDGDALCRAVGVDPKLLGDPEARVPYALAAALGEEALARTGDPELGLNLAQDVLDPRGYDVGALLLMASPTVRAALERLVEHQRYWADGERSALIAAPGGLAIRYRLPGATGAYARHADECAMAETTLGVRALTGRPLSPRLVRFRHARPASTRAHEAVFSCPVEFGAAHTELVLDDDVLDTRLEHANEVFFAAFEEQVRRALARLPPAATTSSDVRATIRATLAGGGCTLEGTAKRLGTSTRSLQRRLQTEGTTFAEIVDALRRELAITWLDAGLPVAAVAAELGYADATAFHHAFRRWTGTSPSRRARRDD